MYRQPQAIAITATNPFSAAAKSFKNMLALTADFMYGTPERVRITYAFAFGLALLGGYLMQGASPLAACAA